MYIRRDIENLLTKSSAGIQVLLGPRQCGKSTLFASLSNIANKNSQFKEITFDDLQMRQLANHDPALFLQQFEPPLLLDEVQYVPNLFPELKKRIVTRDDEKAKKYLQIAAERGYEPVPMKKLREEYKLMLEAQQSSESVFADIPRDLFHHIARLRTEIMLAQQKLGKKTWI